MRTGFTESAVRSIKAFIMAKLDATSAIISRVSRWSRQPI